MQLLTLFLTAPFSSTNSCGYFHIIEWLPFGFSWYACQFHMFTRPYVIVILSDFDLIFCFVRPTTKNVCLFVRCIGMNEWLASYTHTLMKKTLSMPLVPIKCINGSGNHRWWYLHCRSLLFCCHIHYNRKKITIRIFFFLYGSAIVAFLFKWINIGKKIEADSIGAYHHKEAITYTQTIVKSDASISIDFFFRESP